jgi:AmmeMemoRadiSam system protein B
MKSQSIRAPAVAGLFYDGNPERLSTDVMSLLAAATPSTTFKAKAMVVPHAGYVYSGPIAATAYRALQDRADTIRRVVLLGPTHRVAVHGLAVPTVAGFSTPLGTVPLDQAAIGQILDMPQVVQSDLPHEMEHGLEVQLPFLQRVLRDFMLVPLAVGHAGAREVAEVLERLWGGDETLILVSSDLSHYHPYSEAKRLDGDTVQSILALQGPLGHEQACGATPLNGLLQIAREKGLTPHLLDLRNSGDTAGDRDRVVGYAAIAFTQGNGHVH